MDMDLKAFLRSLPSDEAREAFAVSCGTSLGHMRNCIYTSKQLAPATCVLVWQNSEGKVPRWLSRPNDWHKIWPELIGTAGAPDIPAEAAQ